LLVTLFVGDDWAEDHHDVEVLDGSGRRLARARLAEGMAGISRLHELLAEHLGEESLDPDTGMLAGGEVVVGIETDRGPWGAALVAAGYQVFAINPMSARGIGSGTRPRGRSPTQVMRTCWPRSCGGTGRTIDRWPATVRRSRG
jgi:hypothetical protein